MIQISSNVALSSRPLGGSVIENYATLSRRVMQAVSIPLREADNFRLGDPVTVLDSGTGQAERCQVERWLAPFPSGAEKLIRVHYPAALTPNNLRIGHTFERSPAGAVAAHSVYSTVLLALQNVRIEFFCGPKATHRVVVYEPGRVPDQIIRDGDRVKTWRFFSRVYEPSHAPTLRTQVWAEVEIDVLSDQNYLRCRFSWGIDDPRINEYGYDRTAFTDEETETGFDFIQPWSDWARPQPLMPASNVQSLAWLGDRWRWIWDRRTRNTGGAVLNDTPPWGSFLLADVVLLCTGGEQSQQRVDDASAWLQAPLLTQGMSDQWYAKPAAYEAIGRMPRRQKTHEHWQNRDAAFVRTALENEFAGMRDVDGSRYCQSNYAWNSKANNFIERIWHQNDGQTGGLHEWWSKNPCIAAVHYNVPGMAHYVRRALYTCPWSYSGYREIDGRELNCIDHPLMGGNRGQPFGLDSHGKSAPGITVPRMRDPVSGGSMIGADTAHFESGWPGVHSAVFGCDGTRKIWRTWLYGPLHLGSWNMDPSRIGAVGELRAWSRGTQQWSRMLHTFGDDRRAVDRCADGFLARNVKPSYDATSVEFPGRKVNAVYFLFPRREGQSRVNLALYRFHRPWEMGHGPAEVAIAELCSHIRPELEWFRVHAQQNAADLFRYGAPRICDEETGQVLYTFLRQGIYEPAQAAAIVDGATRQMNSAEMADNNWTRCAVINGQGECGDPPTNDGYMRLGTPGGGGTTSFTTGVGWMVHDGPLARGDVVLTRYAEQGSFRRTAAPSGNSHAYWLEKDLFKWNAGRADDVVQAPATQRGNHGQAIMGMATSQLNAGTAWVIQPGTPLVARRSITTGAVIEGQDPTPHMPLPNNLCTLTVGGIALVALLDGLGSSRTSFRVYVTQESAIFASPAVVDWTFSLPGNIAANVRAICWAPQLGKFVVSADLATGGSSLWSVGVLDAVANRLSLPMQPVSSAKIIIDLSSIEHVAATSDGVLLTLADGSGNRHTYVWNAEAEHWGCPRHKFQGDTWCAYSLHSRDDDLLRLYTATSGGTFWEHAI